MDCLFCKIIKGEIPSKKIYEDDLCIVIMDAYPEVDGHVLIIPKEHIEDYLMIPNDTLDHLFMVSRKIGPKLVKKLDTNKLSLLINYGDSQAIKHFHLHLLPGFSKGSTSHKTNEEVYDLIKE